MKNQPSSEQILIPDYMEYFGLEVDPFESVSPAFFQEGVRGDQFAQLLHLVQFSDALLGVVGSAGLGKKTFKRELIQRLDSEDVIVEVKASLLSDSYELLCEIAEKFGLELPEIEQGSHNVEQGIDELVNVLREYGRERIENDALKILIIEDAHHLNDQALKVLARLSLHELENNRSIHLVMFGEIEFGERLLELENEKLLVQVFELESFSKEELKHYLRFRLDAVGFEGIFPYKSEDIDFLWEMSRGVPSEVHDAARDILIELASPPPESKSMGLPMPHMALIVLLVAGLLAALFYQSNTSEEPETFDITHNSTVKSESVPASNDSQENSFEQVVPKSIGFKEKVKENAVSMESNNVDSIVKIGPPSEGINDARKIDIPSVSVKQITQQKESLQEMAQASNPLPVITDGSDKPGLSAERATEKRVEKPLVDEDALIEQASRSKVTQDESRLMSLNDESVTLQLLAGGSLDSAQKFVARQPNKEDLAIYSAIRNGKTLYIVVAGIYPTSLQAKDSISSLPEEQQKAGPWPRSLASVKEDIRRFRGL